MGKGGNHSGSRHGGHGSHHHGHHGHHGGYGYYPGYPGYLSGAYPYAYSGYASWPYSAYAVSSPIITSLPRQQSTFACTMQGNVLRCDSF